MTNLHQGQFDMEALVFCAFVVEVTLVDDIERGEQQRGFGGLCLFEVSFFDIFGYFEQFDGGGIAADEQVSQVFGQPHHKIVAVESFAQHFVEEQQCVGDILAEHGIYYPKVVVVVQDVKVFDGGAVAHAPVRRKSHDHVKEGECVAHGPVGFLGDEVQGFHFGLYAFGAGDAGDLTGDVGDLDAVEVEDLAAGEDGRQDLMLFGGGEDENGISGGFFQGFEEGIEGRGGEHVYLVNDIDLPGARLWRVAYLLYQVADVVHGVVGGGIQFDDVEGGPEVKTLATVAGVAGFVVFGAVLAVDGFGQDTGAGGFADPTRAAEQKRLCQVVGGDGVFEGIGDVGLSHDRAEGRGAVFSGGYDEIFHSRRKLADGSGKGKRFCKCLLFFLVDCLPGWMYATWCLPPA